MTTSRFLDGKLSIRSNASLRYRRTGSRVAGRKHERDGFVYKCVLDPDCVIADTRRGRLPPRVFAALLRLHMPWHRRLAHWCDGALRRRFARNVNWFVHAERASHKFRQRHMRNVRMNALIDVCKSVGIDVLLSPSAVLHGDQVAHLDEGVYGTVALLLSPSKARIVACHPA